MVAATRHGWSVVLTCLGAALLCALFTPLMAFAVEPKPSITKVSQQQSIPQPRSRRVQLAAHSDWADAGMDVIAGETMTFSAEGTVTVACRDKWGQGPDICVGPEGTFLVSDGIAMQQFPMPSGLHGPAACFAVIGRVGNGEPFYIGGAMSRIAMNSGRLQLRVNAFDAAHVTGCFEVQMEVTKYPGVASVAPMWIERTIPPTAAPGTPRGSCRVIVFYVDGLRPDVAREMVAMGHLPTIRELFVDGGTWLKHNFTAFPSDTITSNGTMWTGCFSDRHGLKAQVRFSRDRVISESYLEPLGPSRSSKQLGPIGIDRLALQSEKKLRNAIDGEESSEKWYRRQVVETPPIYSFLRQNGQDWATGVLPIMTEVPPPLWTRSLTRELPWFESHNAWHYIDDANANYAIRHLLTRDIPVTVLWFPETDSVSHKCSRGQFGATRRTIVQADELIGSVVNELKATGKFETTSFILVSDHGHHGGRTTHLRHFDIANDFLFPPREIDSSGKWVGGGMGLSVRMHRFWNRHPEHHQREFVFVDGDSSGVARLFFPKRCMQARDWSGPNRPGDLLRYEISDNLPPVNLIETLACAKSCTGEPAIDLVLAKLDDSSILISTCDRGQAVIDRQCDQAGRWLYRYRPVSKIWSDDRGGVFFTATDRAENDPLRLIQHLGASSLGKYYDEQTWLALTAGAMYPDSVVALTRHMLWQEPLKEREKEYAPDIVVTARPGWYFGVGSTPGTNHGYPLYDAMHASWFASGPGIRRGAVLETPTRLVDLTPTILDMIGADVPFEHFDGVPRRQIYETDRDHELPLRGVSWHELDLGGWGELSYQPIADSEFKPKSINRPESPLDMSNAVYSIAAIADTSVFRIFDDVISPLTGSYAEPGVAQTKADKIDAKLRRSPSSAAKDTSTALNIPEAAVSDYTITSFGNMRRISGAVDWLQGRTDAIDRHLAGPFGKDQTHPNKLVNKAVDGTQSGFWEGYRFGQRVIVEALDETLLNGFENTVDRSVNSFRKIPAERRVERSGE